MRITNKMRNKFRELAETTPVTKIAEMFGVSDTTVYYHICDDTAARRRETWRVAQQKRRRGIERAFSWA